MTWDYIIVGAGSAGCAVAYELATAQPEAAILVLEAGGSDRSAAIKLPAGVLHAGRRYDWGYQSQPDPSRAGASEAWLRGKVLGGSSSINGMIYVRGAAEDFDRWAQQCQQLGGWSAAEVLPLFEQLENSDQNGSLRGHAGPLHVTTVRHPHAVTKAFVSSASSAALRYNEDYNGSFQLGVSYAQRTIRRGRRWSAADAFLRPILSKGKVSLICNALVERVEISRGRAVAVSFLREGQRQRAAAREIVLCAGAINSPKILMLSGIGDAAELQRYGIEVAVDRPHVGRNLKEHPLLRLVYRSRIATYNSSGGVAHCLRLLRKFFRHREGPLSSPFESVAFLRTTPAEPMQDIQLLFFPMGYVRTAAGYGQTPYPAFSVYVIRSHPHSSGRISLASADAADAPQIECRLLDDARDVDGLVRGIESVRRIMSTDPIASLIEAEISPGASISHPQALREFVRSNTEIAFHPIGTCRMGVDPGAVVDPQLRVRGIDNLWVADASIMPDHISANTNAACIMIGKKLGRQLAHGLR